MALLAFAATAHAGGLYLSEFATPDLGTALAGASARAGDAATAVSNPAGMTRLDDHQALLGIAPGFAVVRFDPASDTPAGGSSGGNQGGFLPILSGAYAHKLSDRWRLGIGLVSIAGAVLDPTDDWAGRNEMTDISLLTLSAYPSVGVRLTDWLSIGAGAALTYAKMDWDLRCSSASFPALCASEPTASISDADDFAPAAVASVLVEPRSDVRIGVVYHSETDLDLEGDVSLPPGVSAQTRIGLPLAQFIRTDIFWEATDRLALMLGGGWEDWSAADTVPFTIGPIGGAARVGFQDTWKIRVGAHYRVSDAWRLQTGFSYDSSAVDTSDRIAALPVDRQLRVGFGALWDWTPERQVGLSFQWANLGAARLDNSSVKGSYAWNDLFLFNVNINWKKLPWSGRATL